MNDVRIVTPTTSSDPITATLTTITAGVLDMIVGALLLSLPHHIRCWYCCCLC